MKEENLNIDKLFEESLAGLKVEPQADSWDKVVAGIEAAAGSGKKKLFRWAALAAAALAVVLYFFFAKGCSTDGASLSYAQNKRLNVLSSGTFALKPQKFVEKNNEQTIAVTKIAQNSAKISKHKIHNAQSAFATKNDKAIITSMAEEKNETLEQNGVIAETKDEQIDKTIKDVSISSQTPVAFNSESSTAKTERVESKPEETRRVAESTTINETSKELTDSKKTPAGDQVEKVEKVATVPPPPGPAIATGLAIEFGLGPARVENNLPLTVNYDNPFIESANKNKLTTAEGFVQIKYSFSKFYVKSGLRFSEFGENSTFNVTTELHDTSGGYRSWNLNRYWTYDTIGYYEDPNQPGMVFPILSPTYHIDTISAQWNSRDKIYYESKKTEARNRYRYVEIPLLAGVKFNIKRLGIYGGGGVGIAFMINTSGKYVENNEVKDISFNDNPYKSHNFNYLLNFGADYSLTNRWNVFLEFTYKSNITSIYKDEYFQGKYHSSGLNFGLSYIIK